MGTITKLLASLLACASLEAAVYYVSPTGSDSTGTGSSSSPWATFNYAGTQLSAGDTLVLKNGTYTGQVLSWSGISGTAALPITIRAETDYQATIQGAGPGGTPDAPLIKFLNCNHIKFEGIRVTDSVRTGIWVDGCDFMQFRRNVIRRPSNLGNFNAMVILQSSGSSTSYSNLVEDNLVLQFHRHAIQCYSGGDSNIIRRNYANDLEYRADPSYYPSTSLIAEGMSSYGGTANTFENNIVNSVHGPGFTAHGTSAGGMRNRFYGNIARYADSSGFLLNSRKAGSTYVTNTTVENCVSLRGGTRGFVLWPGTNHMTTNCVSALNTSHGWEINQEDSFWTAAYDVNLQTKNASTKIYECVSVANGGSGFNFGYATGSGGYQGIQYSDVRDSTAYGNPGGTFVVYSSPHVVVTQSGSLTTNPNYDTATYGDGAYLMPAPNQAGRGATVLYRYADGVLTTTELWPWPTDAQLLIEAGIGATYESQGGIWKTLSGVYDFDPPSPQYVNVEAVGPYAYLYPITAQQFRFTRSLSTGSITVHYTIGGTATAGVHYIAFSDQVTFGAGVSEVVATVTPIADSLTDQQTVTVTLDADPLDPDTYIAGANSAATITIVPRAQAGSSYRPPPGQRSFRSFP